MADDKSKSLAEQDRDYTGNAVNARTSEMGDQLDRQARKLDREYAEREDSQTRDKDK